MRDNDIDSYAANLHSTITNLASECIPNKIIKIKPTEPSWINAKIKQYIRKRKRAYRKTKRTNTELHWTQFKTLRNKFETYSRCKKKAFHDKIASKLTSGELSSKDWWTVLKTFISPQSKTSIPPLEISRSHLTPQYLSSLIPPSVSDMSRYNLRNSDQLQTIDSRTNLYYNYVLPSTVRAWNSLPAEVKQSQTTQSFKYYFNKDKTAVQNIIILKIEKPKFSILDYERTVAH